MLRGTRNKLNMILFVSIIACLFLLNQFNLVSNKLVSITPGTLFSAWLENENSKISKMSKWLVYKVVDDKDISTDASSSGFWMNLNQGKVAGRHVAIILHGFGNGAAKRLDIANLIYNLDAGDKRKYYDTILAFEYHSVASIKNIAKEFVRELKTRIDPDAVIDLYGHSMGGLVARWSAEKLDIGHSVDRIVSFCTPHQGIPIHMKLFGMRMAYFASSMIAPLCNALKFEFNLPHSDNVASGISLMSGKFFQNWDLFTYLRKDHCCAMFDVNTESVGKNPSRFLTELNDTNTSNYDYTKNTSYLTIAGTSLHTPGHRVMDALFFKPWGINNDGMVPVNSAHIRNSDALNEEECLTNNYFNIVLPVRHGLVYSENTPIDKFQGLKGILAIIMKDTKNDFRNSRKSYIAKKSVKRTVSEYIINENQDQDLLPSL